jgi:hypothetical protein
LGIFIIDREATMRVIVEDDGGERIFSYASPERHPGEMNTMCAVNKKKAVIIDLAESIQVLCDTMFPIE